MAKQIKTDLIRWFERMQFRNSPKCWYVIDVILNSRCHVVVDDGNDVIWVVFLELCDSSKGPSEAWLWYLKGERCFLSCWLSPVLSPWRHEGFQCFSPCCCKTHAAISTALPRYLLYGLYSSKRSVFIVYIIPPLGVPSVLGFCKVKKFKSENFSLYVCHSKWKLYCRSSYWTVIGLFFPAHI